MRPQWWSAAQLLPRRAVADPDGAGAITRRRFATALLGLNGPCQVLWQTVELAGKVHGFEACLEGWLRSEPAVQAGHQPLLALLVLALYLVGDHCRSAKASTVGLVEPEVFHQLARAGSSGEQEQLLLDSRKYARRQLEPQGPLHGFLCSILGIP